MVENLVATFQQGCFFKLKLYQSLARRRVEEQCFGSAWGRQIVSLRPLSLYNIFSCALAS